jgi:hypothetical protein
MRAASSPDGNLAQPSHAVHSSRRCLHQIRAERCPRDRDDITDREQRVGLIELPQRIPIEQHGGPAVCAFTERYDGALECLGGGGRLRVFGRIQSERLTGSGCWGRGDGAGRDRCRGHRRPGRGRRRGALRRCCRSLLGRRGRCLLGRRRRSLLGRRRRSLLGSSRLGIWRGASGELVITGEPCRGIGDAGTRLQRRRRWAGWRFRRCRDRNRG